MKKILFAFIAMLAVSIAAMLFTNYRHDKDSLFYQNVEALAQNELPGESDNCDDGGERCLYHYGHSNYNIETKKNKR